ncbi:acyltransferase [Herbaspirillum huttiense]|uniref:acyltransferase n=1 Tax=Herbaspirillum huttiense TaxID=863372 RepID=UPI0039AF9C89
MKMLRNLSAWIFLQLLKRRVSLTLGRNVKVHWPRLMRTKGGVLAIGENSIVNAKIDFDGPEGFVSIGQRCFIGASHLVCRERICIHDDVVISWGVTIVDHNSHSLFWNHRSKDVLDWANGRKDWSNVQIRPVEIHEKVWIGFGASILKGVSIGEGAVVGACAVVTRDVPPYSVVAGNPARIIKQIEKSESNGTED